MNESKISVKIKKLCPDAITPTVSYKNDVGYDIYAVEDVEIPYGYTKEVKTGIALQLPEGYYCSVETRSGAGKAGKVNHRGIIDPDYRGEVSVFVRNISLNPDETKTKTALEIKKGDRIAQLTFHKAIYVENFEVVNKLDETERGEKGHGSSGK